MILTNFKYFLNKMYNCIKLLFLLVFRKPACFVECVYTQFIYKRPTCYILFLRALWYLRNVESNATPLYNILLQENIFKGN